MKNKIVFAVLCNMFLLLSTSTSFAAFPIKKEIHKNNQTSLQTQANITATTATDQLQFAEMAHAEKTYKKHSFLSKLLSHATAAAAGVSQVVYIILAILPFGWLGIGLNEDWQGNHWWIALILYFCFWLPGIIYSFIMMPNYY